MLISTDPSQQVDALLGATIAAFDMPDEVYERVDRRYHDVAGWLNGHWSRAQAGGDIYPQGSFLLGTVVQPVTAHAEYDIDLVCCRDLLKQSTTQRELKADVGQAVKLYAASGPDGQPNCAEGKRCWTLDYLYEPFHMDVLPAIPDNQAPPGGILLTDRDLREWQHSNPRAYALWFRARMRREFDRTRDVLAKQMEVDTVTEWTVKTTLQRTVQALKRHRDLYFADRPDDRPASIIITTLAARAYTGAGKLYEVLLGVTGGMAKFVELREGVWWVENPVQKKENFADRWQTHPERARSFFEWLERVQTDVRDYGADLGAGTDRLLIKFARSFGDGPARHAGREMGDAYRRERDQTRLTVGATGLLSVDGAGRAVPQHIFHGGERRL